MSDWEAERKKQNDAEDQWARALAAELGEGWTAKRCGYASLDIEHADGRTLGLRFDGNRVGVYGVLPSGHGSKHGRDYLSRDEQYESCTVSRTRPLNQAAGDVRRKVLPSYTAAFEVVKARVAKDAEAHAKAVAFEAELAPKIGKKVRTGGSSRQNHREVYKVEGGTYDNSFELEITPGGYTETDVYALNLKVRIDRKHIAKMKPSLIAFLKTLHDQEPAAEPI